MDVFDELLDLEGTKEYARVSLAFEVSHKIGLILDKKGWSMAKLGEEMGCSRANVQQLLSGKQNLTLGKLAEICFALKVDPLELFGSTKKCQDHSDKLQKYQRLLNAELSMENDPKVLSFKAPETFFPRRPSGLRLRPNATDENKLAELYGCVAK